jgi:ribosome-binding protein aMBF1 (putative translation factor)
MRTLVEPPRSTHCKICGGELRHKRVDSANRGLDLESVISVCVKCGHEQSRIVSHDHNARHMPDPKAA